MITRSRSPLLIQLLTMNLAIALAATGSDVTSVAPTPSETPDSPVVPPQTYTAKRTGDEITLKSGSILHGVRVIRETPFQLVLEVLPTIEPLIIPARQVSAIKYGKHRPRHPTPPEPEAPADNGPRMLQAVKTAPELLRKMATPFADAPLTFERQDILITLRALGILSGVPVSLGPRLELHPIEERIGSVEIESGVSFDAFIAEHLARQAPWIGVEFHYDSLHFYRRTPKDDDNKKPPSETKKGPEEYPPGRRSIR